MRPAPRQLLKSVITLSQNCPTRSVCDMAMFGQLRRLPGAVCPRFASVLCELTWAEKYPGADASFRRLPVASRPLRFNFHHSNFPQGVMPKTAPFPSQVSAHRALANLGHRAAFGARGPWRCLQSGTVGLCFCGKSRWIFRSRLWGGRIRHWGKHSREERWL